MYNTRSTKNNKPNQILSKNIINAKVVKPNLNNIPNKKRQATEEAHGTPQAKKYQASAIQTYDVQPYNAKKPMSNRILEHTTIKNPNIFIQNAHFHNTDMSSNQFSLNLLNNQPQLNDKPSTLNDNTNSNSYINPLFYTDNLENHQTPQQIVKKFKSLTTKYLEIKHYNGAYKEAKQGLTLSDCSHDDIIWFLDKLVFVCNNVKDYAGVKQFAFHALKLPNCTRTEREHFYNQLTLTSNPELFISCEHIEFSKVISLGISVKYPDFFSTQKEELQTILNLLEILQSIKDNELKKEIINRLLDVIAFGEITTNLLTILEAPSCPKLTPFACKLIKELTQIEKLLQ